MAVLATARLQLQPFDDQHYDGLRALNSDPEVMRYITGRPETAEETTAFIARVKAAWATLGYSWWAFIRQRLRAVDWFRVHPEYRTQS